MSDIINRLTHAIDKLGTQYAGLLVNPELKKMKQRLEKTFNNREIDYNTTDLTRELKEAEDVGKLIDDVIVGTMNILEDKLEITVAYIQTEEGVNCATVNGLAQGYITSVNT